MRPTHYRCRIYTVSASIPDPALDIKDLRLVLALAREGTTARAAKVLHLAQPSVSRALLSLEDRLEVPLFEREARGLVLTQAGAEIVDKAAGLLDALVDLERTVRAPIAPRRRIRLVCECYTVYHWLPSVLASLKDGLADLDLRLRVEHTTDPLAALAADEIDAALVTSPCRPSSELKVRGLMSDELVFVVAKSHPLAAQGTLTPQDLERTPLFTQRAPIEESRWFMREVFGRKRPRLDVTTVPLTEAVVDLARAGMGIAILTEWVTKPYLGRGGFVAKRLSRGPLRRHWRFAWRSEIGDVGPRLYRTLRATLPNPT